MLTSSPAGPAGRAAVSGIAGAAQPRSRRPGARRAASRGPSSCRCTAVARSGKIPASSSSTVRRSVSGAPRVGCGCSPRRSASTSAVGGLDGLVVEVLVVHLQHRGEVARGQALGVLQRDRPWGAGLAAVSSWPDVPSFAGDSARVDLVAAQRRAQRVRADAHQVLAARRALVHRVERRDRRDLGGGQLQHLGAVADAVLADVALDRLHEVQQRQQRRPRLRVPRDDLRGPLPGQLVEDGRERRLLGYHRVPLDLVRRGTPFAAWPLLPTLSGCPPGVVIGPHLP